MFAAVKVIVAIGIACGTMVASIVETPYPRFAFCFWMLGERGLLRQQMDLIGDTVTSPWTLLRRPTVSFAAARREAQEESR